MDNPVNIVSKRDLEAQVDVPELIGRKGIDERIDGHIQGVFNLIGNSFKAFVQCVKYQYLGQCLNIKLKKRE